MSTILIFAISLVVTFSLVRALELEPARGLSAGFPAGLAPDGPGLSNDVIASLLSSMPTGSSSSSSSSTRTTQLTSQANHGLDVSTAVTRDEADCLVPNYSFIIARGWHSYGAVDTEVCNTLTHANAAGFTKKEVYFFPCPTCSTTPAAQLQSMIDYINANCPNHWSKRIWLDIEGKDYWSGNYTVNQNWYEKLVDSCKNKMNGSCGVYSSASQWSAIFGSSYNYQNDNNLPLWYAYYDGVASFDGFSPFAGWKTPYAKQYQGGHTVCGQSVDANYSPSF